MTPEDRPGWNDSINIAYDGDVATYQECKNPDCSAYREGYGHAHLVRTIRTDGTIIDRPLPDLP